MSPTPPSTTSSSISTHSPEGQYRVIRKRNRVPLSCGPCRHRKLKCNRSHPCENCVKRGDATSCTYAQGVTRKKNSSTNQSSSSPDEMQNRIDRLESLVMSLMNNGAQSAGPAAAMAALSGGSSADSVQHMNDLETEEDGHGGPEESETEQVTKSFGIMKVDNKTSYYISDAHWASVLHEISEVRNYFNTHKKQFEEQAMKLDAARPPTFLSGSALLFGGTKPSSRAEIMSSLPSKYTTDLLIARYFTHYDPATHFLHSPTFQAQYNKHWEDPSQTSIVWIGMIFCMMRLAMLSYFKEGDEPPEFRGKSLDMSATFRNLMAQCLILADYTKPFPYVIETLALHLHGEFSQAKETDVGVWILVAVITRLAMRMGYHRDSKMFPNISPFDGEMRRRVWTYVRQADLLFSSQIGLPPMIRTENSDTDLPRNLYDDDFMENCKELPASRPPNEPTPMSYLINKARITYVFGRVIEQESSIKSGSYDTVMEIDAELRRARDLIPEHLLIRPLEDCPAGPTNSIVARFSVMSVYHKSQCMLHRRYMDRARENPRFTYSRRSCIDSAMELLRYQSMVYNESGPTGRLRNRKSWISSLRSTDFMLAATIVCHDLYQSLQFQTAGRPSGDTYTWGRERREEMMAALRRSKKIWDELRDETLEAWKAASMLGVMLGTLNPGYPSTDTNTAPTFESQDEKQNAAMTLGLLSSGMNGASTATPSFSDPAFKMPDTPLTQPGNVGTPADIRGASSPFSSMFGQMPDMQLNLDWDAWDAYIQNPPVELSNQFWPIMDFQQQQQGPLVDGARPPSRYLPMISPQPNAAAYDPNGYCFRRAALRLVPSSSFVPAPSSKVTTLNAPRPLLATHPTRTDFQRRWNSHETSKQTEGNTSASADSNKADVAAADEENAQVTDAAVHAMSAASIRPNEVPNVGEAKFEAREESQTEPETQAQAGQRGANAGDAADQSAPTRPVSRRSPGGTSLGGQQLTASSQEILERRRRRAELLQREPSPRPTLFISNLFYDTTAEDLRKEMEKFGEVEQCSIVHDNRGMSKGIAYVQFATVEAATQARDALHLSVMEGRRIVARYAHFNLVAKANAQTATRTLYIANLPFDMTDADINQLFRDIPNVIDVRVSVDRRTGQIRGFCHAEFLDVKSAQMGFESLNSVVIRDRKLRLDFSPDQRTAVPIKRVFSK